MKRRYAYSPNDNSTDYRLKRIDEDYFKGYLCRLKMNEIKRKIKVNVNGEEYYILNDNYLWYEVYPDNENYAITIMYDDNNNLVQWYFDVSKNIGVENGIPYEDDLYLDLVIRPNGDASVLDEDELKEALEQKKITEEDFDFAYIILEKLQREYANNFDHLVALTEKFKEEFNVKRR